LAALVLNRLVRGLIGRGVHRLGQATQDYGENVVTERSVDRAEQRAATIGSLLRSLATAVIYGVALVMILEVLGLSIIPILVSAGVLGLAIGFGAQSVVEDMLRGVFMLSEDQLGVGDRIDVGFVNGYVERVTLRTVVIRDADGTTWHVPNSEIARVANENQLNARASVEIGVSYVTDLDRAITVLGDALEEISQEPEWAEVITEDPVVQGVQDLGPDKVRLRVVGWVTAGKRRAFERYLRLRLKDALDRGNITTPNQKVDVWIQNSPQVA
jgi:small-conductance mechanosensitive channel